MQGWSNNITISSHKKIQPLVVSLFVIPATVTQLITIIDKTLEPLKLEKLNVYNF